MLPYLLHLSTLAAKLVELLYSFNNHAMRNGATSPLDLLDLWGSPFRVTDRRADGYLHNYEAARCDFSYTFPAMTLVTEAELTPRPGFHQWMRSVSTRREPTFLRRVLFRLRESNPLYCEAFCQDVAMQTARPGHFGPRRFDARSIHAAWQMSHIIAAFHRNDLDLRVVHESDAGSPIEQYLVKVVQLGLVETPPRPAGPLRLGFRIVVESLDEDGDGTQYEPIRMHMNKGASYHTTMFETTVYAVPREQLKLVFWEEPGCCMSSDEGGGILYEYQQPDMVRCMRSHQYPYTIPDIPIQAGEDARQWAKLTAGPPKPPFPTLTQLLSIHFLSIWPRLTLATRRTVSTLLGLDLVDSLLKTPRPEDATCTDLNARPRKRPRLSPF